MKKAYLSVEKKKICILIMYIMSMELFEIQAL